MSSQISPAKIGLPDPVYDPVRLRAVEQSGFMDSPSETTFDEIGAQLRKTLDVPISLITVVGDQKQYFKCADGIEGRETPLEDAVCQHVVREKRLFIVEDLKTDVFLRHHPGMLKINASAYLGTPLYFLNQAIGSVCVVDFKPRKWTEADISFLEGQAEKVTNILNGRA